MQWDIATVNGEFAATVDAGVPVETPRIHVPRAVVDLSESLQLQALPETAALLVCSRLDADNTIFRSLK